MRRYLIALSLILVLALLAGCDSVHFHEIEKMDAVPSTCVSKGNGEYYYCKSCKGVFSDAKGSHEIDIKSVLLPVDEDCHYGLIKVEEVEATCSTTGMGEYWECSGCGKTFADEKGTTEVDTATLVTPKVARAHSLRHIEAKAPTCAETGLKEYWLCRYCGLKYSSEDGKGLIADAVFNTILGVPKDPTNHNHVQHVAPKALCSGDFTTEYWRCTDCNKYYLDEEMTTQIAKGDLVTYTCSVREGFVSRGNQDYPYFICSTHDNSYFNGDENLRLYGEYLDQNLIVTRNVSTGTYEAFFAEGNFMLSNDAGNASTLSSMAGVVVNNGKLELVWLDDECTLDFTPSAPYSISVNEGLGGVLSFDVTSSLPYFGNFTISFEGAEQNCFSVTKNGTEVWRGWGYKDYFRGTWNDSLGFLLKFEDNMLVYTFDGTATKYFAAADGNDAWQGTIYIKPDGNGKHLQSSGNRWIFLDGFDSDRTYIKWIPAKTIGTQLNGFTIYTREVIE